MPLDKAPTQNKRRPYSIDHGVTAGTGVAVTSHKVAPDGYNETTLTLTAVAITVADATTSGVTAKICDLPEGVIAFGPSYSSLAFTTTSILANTLNTGSTISYSVGTASSASGDATLAGTEANVISSSSATASATINVAGAAAVGVGGFNIVNGSSTAPDLFVHIGVPTATDIDGDATLTISGTITFRWQNLADAA